MNRQTHDPDDVAGPSPFTGPDEATARALLLHLASGTFAHEWRGDHELMTALGLRSIGDLWAAIDLLEAAGLTQRRLNNGRGIRLHPDVRERLGQA